jgi:hypothetical protein
VGKHEAEGDIGVDEGELVAEGAPRARTPDPAQDSGQPPEAASAARSKREARQMARRLAAWMCP